MVMVIRGGVHHSAQNRSKVSGGFGMEAWDQPVRRSRRPTVIAAVATPGSGSVPFDVAVEVMLRRSGWAARTQQKTREILLGGRFAAFRRAHGVETIDQLTDDHVADFYAGCRAAGYAPTTLIKTRQQLVNLQRFCASTPGYASRVTAAERLPFPRVPERIVEVLTPAEEARLLKACRHERDRLMLEVMLATGIRVGELVALQLGDLRLDERHPHLVVCRSAGEDMTKTGRDRVVALNWAGGTLGKRLARYVDRGRPQSHRLEVFLSLRGDGAGDHAPLSPDAVGALLDRLGEDLGMGLHPHLLRHTWATRAANAGVPMPLLQEAGGWRSLAMVRRYYTADRRAMLEAFARAHRV